MWFSASWLPSGCSSLLYEIPEVHLVAEYINFLNDKAVVSGLAEHQVGSPTTSVSCQGAGLLAQEGQLSPSCQKEQVDSLPFAPLVHGDGLQDIGGQLSPSCLQEMCGSHWRLHLMAKILRSVPSSSAILCALVHPLVRKMRPHVGGKSLISSLLPAIISQILPLRLAVCLRIACKGSSEVGSRTTCYHS